MAESKGRRTISRVVETAILIALPVACHFLLPLLSIVSGPYRYLGIVLMLLGLALSTWTSMTFRRAGASYQLKGESSVLMSSGPFRISRNPMYLGMLIWLIGLAVLLGSLTAFLFPILLFLIMNFLIIPVEEKRMERVLGERFIEYKSRARRWL